MSKDYWRPIVLTPDQRPDAAFPLAGGPFWFAEVEHLRRDRAPLRLPAADMPNSAREVLTSPRGRILGLSMDHPRLMGILNTTPDSFSDGGAHHGHLAAVTGAKGMIAAGADIIDIGGESTRPGADPVAIDEEIRRTVPVITALCGTGALTPISIDTRKSDVAAEALHNGAGMFNDVSALTHDPASAVVAAASGCDICLMHAAGDPKTMQQNPRYDDVLLDVYDFLESRIAAAMLAGVKRERIVVDPGIGFGKTLEHNLALLRGIALFHGLGCPVLLGASRKRFIGQIAGVDAADRRGPGSIAIALAAVNQGVQILRVHDVAETRQALSLWSAVHT